MVFRFGGGVPCKQYRLVSIACIQLSVLAWHHATNTCPLTVMLPTSLQDVGDELPLRPFGRSTRTA